MHKLVHSMSTEDNQRKKEQKMTLFPAIFRGKVGRKVPFACIFIAFQHHILIEGAKLTLYALCKDCMTLNNTFCIRG